MVKDTLLLLGKPLCSICESASAILTKVEDDYTVKRINILSLFSKNGGVRILGMKVYELMVALTEVLGNEYAILFKISADTGEAAYVPFRPFVMVAQMDPTAVDYSALREAISSAKYGEWPPSSRR